MPVTQIDDRVVANGRPGTLSRLLREAYVRYMNEAEPAA
jgi:branched-subunit amino acid aminotransferase/4-amino-4-deoxychorismate lyase